MSFAKRLRLKSPHAFTLLECLIAISIIAILAAFSFPSMRQLMQHHQDKLLQQSIIQLIQLAQDQAINRSQSIGLKQNSKNEMIIFADNEEKLIVRQLNLPQGELRIRSYPYYRDYLRFSPGRNDNGTISYFKSNKRVWAIVVSQTGRIRIQSIS